jgi:hypothetical protein
LVSNVHLYFILTVLGGPRGSEDLLKLRERNQKRLWLIIPEKTEKAWSPFEQMQICLPEAIECAVTIMFLGIAHIQSQATPSHIKQ